MPAQAFHLADSQQESPDFSGLGAGALQWGDSDLDCFVDEKQLNLLTLTIASNRRLQVIFDPETKNPITIARYARHVE